MAAAWTEREVALLRAVYPLFGIACARAVLPARSTASIKAYVRDLGLRAPEGGPRGPAATPKGRLDAGDSAVALAAVMSALASSGGRPAARRRAPMWSAAEDATLDQAYRRGGIDAAMRALPGRTKRAIYQRVSTLRRGKSDLPARASKSRDAARDNVPAASAVGVELPAVRASAPPRRRRSFEEQLEAARNGARLERAWRAPSPADLRTLGGVSAGWGQ